MKKKLGTVILVIALALTLVPMSVAYAAPPTLPPPGEHFTFNCVTELSTLFSDAFDGGSGQWIELSGTWAIVDDGGNDVYSGTATADEQVTYAQSTGTFDNFIFEAKVKANNNAGHYGIVLREDGTGKHYGFYLNAYPVSEGKYYFGYWDGTYNPIVGWTDSGGAYTDAQTWNTLKVVAKDYQFELYINGTLVATVTDTVEYAASGHVGLIVDKYAIGQNTYFDDVNISGLKPTEILVPLNGSGMLGFIAGSPFQILDNDMTDGQAWVQIPAGLYDTYDQARGKPGGDLYWGNYHARSAGKPVWNQHNVALPIPGWGVGNWLFTNNGVTCYSFRLYPLP